MKATLPLAALLSAALIAQAQAQQGQAARCPDCGSKDLLIRQMQAEILALKGEPAEPSPAAPARQAAGPASLSYTVQPGDGLLKIARMTGCTPAELAQANGLTLDSVIHSGQTLKLPEGATLPSPATPQSQVAGKAPKPKTYTIQDGDTYYSLSRRMNIPLEDLMAANPKAKATQLYTGRVINLPAAAAAADTAETPPAPVTQEQAAESPSPEPPNPDKIISVNIEEEISYGDFASKYQTDVQRLNSLNNLDLTSATILAKGSQLYVPVPADPSVVGTPGATAGGSGAENSL